MNDINSASQVEPIEKALARNRMYALLAKGFRYPDTDAFTLLTDGAYAETIAEAIKVCAPELRGKFEEQYAADLMIAAPVDALVSAYLNAFETNMPEPSVSLYEGSHHQRGNRPALLIELKSFYLTFGLAVAESDNDLEDGITAELEFMQFLTAKQAQAEDEGLQSKPYLHAQRDFLERHLAAWVPALQAEASAKLKHPFYVALVGFAADFVAHDFVEVQREATDQGL